MLVCVALSFLVCVVWMRVFFGRGSFPSRPEGPAADPAATEQPDPILLRSRR